MLLYTIFETALLAMCNDQCLVVFDYEVFGRLSQQYTYVSDAQIILFVAMIYM